MSELTLGQTVARDVLMVIALLQGREGSGYLNDTAQTGDERDEVFGRIADAVDDHALAMRHTLEDVMISTVARGILGTPLHTAIDFRSHVIEQLKNVGYSEDQAKEIVNHLTRARTPPPDA